MNSLKRLKDKKVILLGILSLLVLLLVTSLLGIGYFVYKGVKSKSTTKKSSEIVEKISKSILVDRNGEVLFTYSNGVERKKAPHFVDYVNVELSKILKDEIPQDQSAQEYLKNKGYTITSTLDLTLNDLIEKEIQTQIATSEFQSNIGAQNAGALLMDPNTSDILAMVGSKDYDAESKDPRFSPQSNSILRNRSYGSLTKPILYLAALRTGIQPSEPLPDYRLDLKAQGAKTSYFVQDNSRIYAQFGQYVSMRTAIANGLNVPAVATLQMVGNKNYVDTYKLLTNWVSIDRQINGPASALGVEMPFIEQTQAYATLANEGYYTPRRVILEIKDKDGVVVYDGNKTFGSQVIDKKVTYTLNNLVSSYWLFDKDGKNSDPYLKELQSKTDIIGISGLEDTVEGKVASVSFISYSPDFVLGLWVGNDCGGVQCPLSGGQATGEELYKNMYKQILQKYISTRTSFSKYEMPSGVSMVGGCSSFDKEKKCLVPVKELLITGPFNLERNKNINF
jgi:membrane peptidoglycan carboxypeptidase